MSTCGSLEDQATLSHKAQPMSIFSTKLFANMRANAQRTSPRKSTGYVLRNRKPLVPQSTRTAVIKASRICQPRWPVEMPHGGSGRADGDLV